MFGGTTHPYARKRPTETRLLPEAPSVWIAETADAPLVISTRTGVLVLVGLCGATSTQVATDVRGSVPDDVTCRWPGAYVAVHVEEHQVHVWTDLGALPVYARPGEDGEVIWSTSARALASFDSAPRLDIGAVAGFIEGRPVEHSLFAGVCRLPAGHRALLRRGVWSATPVWSPRLSPVPTARRLRRALESAVAVRVDRFARPTCDFSGGLDSTSLALLAARRLTPASRIITGTTLHPVGIRSGGDLDYARDAATASGFDHAWIGMDDSHAPYRDLAALPPTDEPPVSAVSVASFAAQMRWLSAHGSDVHMTGDGGDALLLTPPVYFAEMIKRHRLRALRAASRFAQVRRKSMWQVLGRARTFVPEHTGLRLPSITHQQIVSTLVDSARSARADVELAASLGVRLDNPFFDAQVIDAYLAMPLEEIPEPARYKPLLVEAMSDVLPISLQARGTKATTTADHYEGLRRSLSQVSAMLDGHLADAGLIDVPTIRSRVRTLASGAGDLGSVEPIIAAEAWCRAMKPVPWEDGGPR